MKRSVHARVLHLLRVLLGAVVVLAVRVAAAADPWADVRPRAEDFVGTLSCMSASCHGGIRAAQTTGLSPRQIYVHWLNANATDSNGRQAYDPRARVEKTDADPHALAAQRMLEPRFQEVLRRVSRRADGSVDVATYQRCARCHDPLTVAAEAIPLPLGEGGERSEPGEGIPARPRWNLTTLTPALSRREREYGIGCESCHGGTRRWLARHYEQDVSREELVELGMIDTKNLLVRARQCAACHVGSVDQDMNHDMIAAGHPPLRFELASHEALLPRKHWDDGQRRAVEPNYEVQLWAAGRIAAAEAALALLEGRARRAAARPQETANGAHVPWPEYAEANCFACHQPLRGQHNKLLSTVVAKGHAVPRWQTWNIALSSLVVPAREFGRAELPPPAGALAEAIASLRLEMERSLIPSADEVAHRAAHARVVLRLQVQVTSSGAVLGRGNSHIGPADVMSGLAQSSDAVNWDQMCQELAAMVAVERSLLDRGAVDAAQGSALRQNARQIAARLRFKAGDREWPVVFDDDSGETLEKTKQELGALRRALADAVSRIDGRLPATEASR